MLIDTNILLDSSLEREPHYRSSSEILERLREVPGRAFIAWHSVATFYYIASDAIGGANARSHVVQMTNFLTVVSTGHAELDYALSLPMGDFEDAMQVAAAHAAGVRYIITRNIRDFTNSPIPAITPEQALQELF